MVQGRAGTIAHRRNIGIVCPASVSHTQRSLLPQSVTLSGVEGSRAPDCDAASAISAPWAKV